MTEWPIDCAMFLRLTSTHLGEYGMHFIAPAGVRALRSADEISQCAVLEIGETADLLDFVAAAKLDFPTTTSVLLAWVNDQHGDFVLPVWFVDAAATSTPAEARHILKAAQTSLATRLDTAHAKAPSTDILGSYVATLSHNEARAELDALEALQHSLDSCGRTGEVHRQSKMPNRPSPQRMDDLAIEIDAIVDALKRAGERVTAPRVMGELRARAGKPGSCISDVAADDCIIWSRASTGSVQKLDLKALAKRLKLWA